VLLILPQERVVEPVVVVQLLVRMLAEVEAEELVELVEL
jgi:hypothetical protein